MKNIIDYSNSKSSFVSTELVKLYRGDEALKPQPGSCSSLPIAIDN